MSAYESNIKLEAAAAQVRAARRVWVATHAKPDGDAFGAVAALTAALRLLDADTDVTGWLIPPVPTSFRTLAAYPVTQQLAGDAANGDARDDQSLNAEPDLIVVLDTGAWVQVAAMRDMIEPHLDRTLVIDHHLSGDIAAAGRFIDSTAAACCEIVADLLDLLDGDRCVADPAIAEALFAGIASDTGWFRFSNTSARTHRLAARLMEAGVDHADLYRRLEQSERPSKLALQIRAMKSMKLLADGRVAIMVLRADDFAQTGALPEETERFVDIPQSVETVKMVVLVTQTPDAERNGAPVRISFRSKPGPDAVNVAEFARQFGGGGHARAAGAKVDAPVEQVIEQVEQAVAEAMKCSG